MADTKPNPCIVKWNLFTCYLNSPPFGRAAFGSTPFGRAIMGCSVIPIVKMKLDNVMLLKYWAPIWIYKDLFSGTGSFIIRARPFCLYNRDSFSVKMAYLYWIANWCIFFHRNRSYLSLFMGCHRMLTKDVSSDWQYEYIYIFHRIMPHKRCTIRLSYEYHNTSVWPELP